MPLLKYRGEPYTFDGERAELLHAKPSVLMLFNLPELLPRLPEVG